MTKELVVEQRLEQATVVENVEEGGRRRLVFEAIVSEMDYVNKNGRMYPADVLWPLFEQVNADISAYPGEVDHPLDPHRQSFSNNGIRWHSFWREGNYVKGRGEVIWTARGTDLAANLEAGVKVGFSTRTWAGFEEVEMEGRTVRVAREADPPYVDAVVKPSVNHARVTVVSREEEENNLMEKELQAALEAKGAAEGKLTDAAEARQAAEQRATTAEQRVTTLESEIEQLKADLKSAQDKLAEIAATEAEGALSGKLNSLTEGHRFAATIVTEARKLGVTLENAEVVVSTLKALVEAAATPDEGTPRGDVSTREDENENTPEVSAEQEQELRLAGLA